MNRFYYSLILIFISAQVNAQTSDKQAEIDNLFASWDTDSSPGVALGIIKDGKLVYSKGYGIADLEHDVKIDPTTVFYMASVSKHFVTMCILLLEEEGKLNLDAEIQEYLPDFPRYDDPLTVRHFIHHTSGVRDYLTLWSLSGNTYMDHIKEEEVYELIKNQKELNFIPGSEYLYSNSCYFMLAMIIEEISGQSIREFGDENLFGPLGMKNTHFHNDVYHLIKNRAFSYRKDGDNYQNLIMRFDLVGSGGLYSNIDDMYLWDQNFDNNKLGTSGQILIDKMHEEGLLNSGESTRYAFGLSNGEYKGLKTVSHGGALAGYRTYFLRFPENNISIVLLSNDGAFQSGTKAHEVADVVLSDAIKSEEEEGKQTIIYVRLPAGQLEKFVGTYSIQAGVDAEISLKNDSLWVFQKWNQSEYAIAAVDDYSFVIPGNSSIKFVFSDIKIDKAMVMTVDQSGRKSVARRIIKFKGEINLTDFQGSFYSEELNVSYELFIEDNELKYRIGFDGSHVLTVISEDQFTSDGIEFDFNREGDSVQSFTIDAGRVRGIEFKK